MANFATSQSPSSKFEPNLSTYPSKCPICGRGGEPPVTFSVAAKETRHPVSKLRRAAKAGLFPVYHLGDKRALVFVADIVAAILASQKEG